MGIDESSWPCWKGDLILPKVEYGGEDEKVDSHRLPKSMAISLPP